MGKGMVTTRGALTSSLILNVFSLLLTTTSFLGGSLSSPALLAQVASVTLTSTANQKVYTPPSSFTSVKLTNWGLCFLMDGMNPKCIRLLKFSPFILSPQKTLLKNPKTLVNQMGIIDPADAASILPATFNPLSFILLASSLAIVFTCICINIYARTRIVSRGKTRALKLIKITSLILLVNTLFLSGALASTIAFASALNEVIMNQLAQFQITTTVSLYQPLFLAVALVCSGCASWVSWRAVGTLRMEIVEGLEADHESLSQGNGPKDTVVDFGRESLGKEPSFAPFTIGRRGLRGETIGSDSNDSLRNGYIIVEQPRINSPIPTPTQINESSFRYPVAPYSWRDVASAQPPSNISPANRAYQEAYQ
ncbi:UNVERIFIED_CONTAM: hypothetical protein HDU68_007366 [Siphonaria sp. JEL0065]|nr:hypothetical protein HDU68_007366 [Siphonaria sp. JEL0065]